MPIQLIDEITSKEKISWAIDSFKPFKSPEPDGIFPTQLQHTISYILAWLKAIFAGCLKIKYIPQCSRNVNVVFIPKAGKASDVTQKDFRPLSLPSFCFRTPPRSVHERYDKY